MFSLRSSAFQERFYFGDNVLPCFESGIPLLKHRLHQLPDSNNVSVFPSFCSVKCFNYVLFICTSGGESSQGLSLFELAL